MLSQVTKAPIQSFGNYKNPSGFLVQEKQSFSEIEERSDLSSSLKQEETEYGNR